MASTCWRMEARAAASTAFGSLSRLALCSATLQPIGR